MQIGSQFPISSQPPSNRASLPVPVSNSNDRFSDSSVSRLPSSVVDFEQAFQDQSNAKFSRVEGLSASAQAALSAYQETASLSAANPRDALVGVDVFA